MKKPIIYALVLAGILGGSFLFKYIILGGAKPVSLKSDVVAELISTNLQGSSNYRPVEGKDYNVKSIKYFNNKQWLVVSTTPVGTFSDSATIVFKKQGGSYKVVLGPSNLFQDSDLNNLPKDVINHLRKIKVL